MDSNEIIKLTPAQLARLFALALPLTALPVLYIFIVTPALFEQLDTSKLLLLGFSLSAPAYGVFYGLSFISLISDEPNDGGWLTPLNMASLITAILYSLFAVVAVFVLRVKLDISRLLLMLPIVLSVIAGYAILIISAVKIKMKKRCFHARIVNSLKFWPIPVSVCAALSIFAGTYYAYAERHRLHEGGSYRPGLIGFGLFVAVMAYLTHKTLPEERENRAVILLGIVAAESAFFFFTSMLLLLNTFGS